MYNKKGYHIINNEKYKMYREIYSKFCEKYNNDNKNINKILEEILNNKASSFFISKSMILKVINKKIMKLNKLKWEIIPCGYKAIFKFKTGYALRIIKGTEHYYSNGINTYEVALLYNNEISYELHNDIWKYQTEKQVNYLINKVHTLGKFKNKDIPDSTIIKILVTENKKLKQEIEQTKKEIINKKARDIIQLFCDNLDLSNEEKTELKRNPFYVKLLDEFNCLRNKHEIIKSENLKNMKRANEFSKRNKELKEELNKLNYYNTSILRGSE